MPSAFTQSSDMAGLVQARLGEIITQYLYNRPGLVNTPAVKIDTETDWSAGGNSILIRKYAGFTKNSSVATPTDGSLVPTQKVTSTEVTIPCDNRMWSFSVNKLTLADVASDFSLFNEITEQVQADFADYVDLALISKAMASTLVHDISGATDAADKLISFEALRAAKSKWGALGFGRVAYLVVSSAIADKIALLPECRTVDQYGVGAAILTGEVNIIAGMPVIVSDNMPEDTVTADKYTSLIVAPDALQFGLRQAMNAEVKPVPSSPERVLDMDARFYSYLRQTNPSGVVKLTTML